MQSWMRRWACAPFALVLMAAPGVPAAGPVGAELPAVSAAALPERARAVLEAHCAECRDGHARNGALDLAALADDLGLVVPGRPDASPAYQRLLAAETPDAGAGPTPAEVETVRDWIESLPPRDASCRGRAPITHADVAGLIADWTRRHGADEQKDARFLSLAHLWNACLPGPRLEDGGEAVRALLAALARGSAPLQIETLGTAETLFVVRLSRLGLTPDAWVRLTETAPRIATADIVPADWLAAHVLSERASDARTTASAHAAIESLAQLWTRDVDLVRAAAERGVAPAVLAAQLAAVGGEFLLPARRLMHTPLPRPAWDSLSRALDGEARPGSALSGAPPSDTAIDVVLWSDQPGYRPRDLVTFNVAVGRACHLTLIDIDREGKAVVLFPNELEPDNLIAPGVVVRIPGHDAGYQFRFERSGEEQIVAICQRKSPRPAGIAYDYEKQRFAILGDWRTFLRNIPEREKAIRARDDAEAARRKRRGRPASAEEPPAVDPEGPPAEGRAAISITIEPGRP
jgi:hypothetical protein